MISKARCFVAALVLAALAAVPAESSTITVSLGNPSSSLVNGAVTNSLAVTAAQTGTGAFLGSCGTDTALNNNCLASWTFNYLVPAGETVTGGSLSLGLVDIDSKASGSQVNNYSVTGGDNLTLPLNTAAELIQSPNSHYNVFSLALTNFAVFNSGSATVNLALMGPGLGLLPTNSNGAYLIFSRLDLTSTPDSGNPNPVPDPASSAMLLTTSLGILALARANKRAR